jgi:lipopolysaccharide export system permease protein
MFKQIDRLLVIGYIKAYLICLMSMLSLYIVVDLFTNLDEFAHQRAGILAVFAHVGRYYGLKVPQIFDRLCEAIVLLAGMFTVAWMQKNNELLPLLSAGVSTRRVVFPVLVSAGLFLSLAVINQEVVIPRLGNRLTNEKEDVDSDQISTVSGAFEPNGIHIEGQTASRQDMSVRPFCCLIREGVLHNSVHLNAQEGRYIPPGDGPLTGGWLLTGTDPPDLDSLTDNLVLTHIDPGKYFLKTEEVDFAAITRPRNWFQLASTGRLYQELQRPDSMRLAPLAVVFHMRLTRPILGLILVVLGLSTILRDQNRNVFLSAGMCLVLCAVFFAVGFMCKQLGDNDILSPAQSAWLPVLFFGPLAFVMFDAVHT